MFPAVFAIFIHFSGDQACIKDHVFIDPPYNTGNDFVYNDDFAESTDAYMDRSGQYDDQGNRLVINPESNGRFHTDWLNMLYPRIRIAKDLLTDDGVIFISIDDNEVKNCEAVCDEIFGSKNHIATLIWKSKSGGANDSRYYAVDHEYVLVYSRNCDSFIPLIDKEAEVSTSYNRSDEHGQYSLDRLDKPYFLGSIIFKSGKTPNTWDPFSDCKVVIDGQQRLTTLMIFFKVLCLKKNENRLFERDFFLEDGAIVLQHGRNDIAAFDTVMRHDKLEEIPNVVPSSQIILAFNYFLKKIDPDKLDRNIIKQNVQFVCIDLLDGEDEQQVFDTINSLGVRLTTAELLKNYFYNKDNVQEYEKNWVAIFEKDSETRLYWEQELETGRIKRSLIDIFFDAYFQLFLQDKNYSISAEDKIVYSRVDHLAKSYQDFIDHYCNGDKRVVLGQMAEYAKCFAETFRPEYCDMGLPAAPGIERINVIVFGLKNTTLIPYILYVAKNVENQNELRKIYGVLESYLMKRMVFHAPTKNYNNLFTSLILNGVLDVETLKERLNKGNDSTTFVPDDNDLLDGFKTAKLVNLQTRGILYLLEAGIRSAKSSTALLGFDNYSLEHMMPKKWRNNWAPCATDAEARQRDSILLTLGNLAIIPQSLNASIRDSSWDAKKAGKGVNNPGLSICAAGLTTIHDALQKDTWDESEIALRADWLFEQAKSLWDMI